MKTLIMSILGFLSFSANATPEENFWKWFKKNEAIIFEFEKDQERVFDLLSNEMHKVNPNLTFEFGPKINNQREFIISSDGIKEAFPKVESLYSAAPSSLSKWIIIKFRPRREPFDIEYNGISVEAASVLVNLYPDGNKIGVTLIIPSYTEADSKIFTGIAYLILDQALGEYDVETKVGFIQVKSSAPSTTKTYSLTELPKEFDKALQ
ncbi:MAG: hypothetical protein EOO53_18545 [Gammaproteobacteria bacterium]|nr:MAG: hypothetical protein EOO53_18545 [Gammaproteobacteria bacterium]